MDKIKVLVVDDSALVRSILTHILSEDQDIQVIGTAIDPIFAMQKMSSERPDVITLDVEMPRMDGLAFLKQLMKSDPIPVVMISSQTEEGCEVTLRALELGAVDFITKGGNSIRENLEGLKREIITKVKNAARANLRVGSRRTEAKAKSSMPKRELAERIQPRLVVLGASTGGVVAIKQVVAKLRAENVVVLIVQHMPERFTASFATSLCSVASVPVTEAKAGEVLRRGHMYVAPGSKNLVIERRGKDLIVTLTTPEKGDYCVPSVNKAFASVAKAVGRESIGVILTGMGDDGALGMLVLKEAGGHTLAQSKETCMIFGMPRRAIEAGGVDCIVELEAIAEKINSLVEGTFLHRSKEGCP